MTPEEKLALLDNIDAFIAETQASLQELIMDVNSLRSSVGERKPKKRHTFVFSYVGD
jgi:hypothetical protein